MMPRRTLCPTSRALATIVGEDSNSGAWKSGLGKSTRLAFSLASFSDVGLSQR